jgi:hypothetical protein
LSTGVNLLLDDHIKAATMFGGSPEYVLSCLIWASLGTKAEDCTVASGFERTMVMLQRLALASRRHRWYVALHRCFSQFASILAKANFGNETGTRSIV